MKLTKSIEKTLKQIAAKLPPKQGNEINIQRVFYGHALLVNDVKKIKTGDAVVGSKKYAVTKTSFMPVNHFKRLKKVWGLSGMEGVANYVNENQK